MANSASPSIHIHVDGDRLIFEGGPGTHAHRGDTITWTCDFPFAVHFGERTPLEDYSFVRAAGEPLHTTVRPNVRTSAYKYTVIVFTTPSGAPLIDDPEVYIDAM